MDEKDLQKGTLADGLGLKLVEALQNQTDENGDYIEEPVIPEKRTEIKPEKSSPQINVSSDTYVLSENVSRLIHLVNSLPNDVSKHTGAIIIKQTMEAMGISMKDLMIEAKQVQENINTNIRSCMSDIEEAKASIKNLESQIDSYKNLSTELNDLVGLFIVNESNK